MPRDWYILNEDKTPRLADLEEWARWSIKNDKHVGSTEIGDARISTVFVGLDHNWGDGPPLLFETMVFGGKEDGHCERCSTWKQAEAQHETVCAMVRGING